MNKKSILAETLADIQQIKEGIEKNANHVLKSTLKDDLEAIVRKGLNEAVEDETLPQPDDMAGANGLPADPESMGGGSNELPGAEPEAPIAEPIGSEVPDEEIPGDDMPTDLEPTAEPGEPEVIDLTDKSDDEVLQHFNLINPADEIEIVQTPEGGIQITLNPSTGGAPIPGEEEPGDEFPGEEIPGEEVPGEEFPGEEEPTDEPAEPTEPAGR
jgi:hypothetical protein